MSEASKISLPIPSSDIPSVTFSLALRDGLTHCGWLSGPRKDQYGQDRVLARRSVSPDKGKASTIQSDTFGPLFGGSSASAVLQSCLGSRLRAALDVNGSPEYGMTWGEWDMPLGEPICRVAASGRRTSGKDFGGWPTAMSSDANDRQISENWQGSDLPTASGGRAETGSGGGCPRDGWPTPRSTESTETQAAREARGVKASKNLSSEAAKAGWATARAEDAESAGMRHGRGVADTLTAQSRMAGYPTPASKEKAGGEHNDPDKTLARCKGPHSNDLRDFAQLFAMPDMTGWKLNPRFSLWLMGYPAAWASSGARAMQSFRKSRQSSSKQQ